jgi:hypothetical protein
MSLHREFACTQISVGCRKYEVRTQCLHFIAICWLGSCGCPACCLLGQMFSVLVTTCRMQTGWSVSAAGHLSWQTGWRHSFHCQELAPAELRLGDVHGFQLEAHQLIKCHSSSPLINPFMYWYIFQISLYTTSLYPFGGRKGLTALRQSTDHYDLGRQDIDRDRRK